MRLRSRHWLALVAVGTSIVVGCSSSDSSNEETPNGSAGTGHGTAGNSATGGSPARAGAGNGSGPNAGAPGNHTTGMVKLNLKVK